MKQIQAIVAIILFSFTLNAQPVKIMLVTGGHAFDTIQFFQLFDALQGVDYEHFCQPEANRRIADGLGKDFDVLVFYDMWNGISVREKQAYLDLTKEGTPFLFLHHALVSYQNWPEFEQLIGGRYVEKSPATPREKQSTYRHDVRVDIEVVDTEHPVTKGMNDFSLYDEVYGNFRIVGGIKPLLKTNHPESTPVIGWENRYNQSTIIYLQSGHDDHAYESPEYRRLISNAIHFLARGK